MAADDNELRRRIKVGSFAQINNSLDDLIPYKAKDLKVDDVIVGLKSDDVNFNAVLPRIIKKIVNHGDEIHLQEGHVRSILGGRMLKADSEVWIVKTTENSLRRIN